MINTPKRILVVDDEKEVRKVLKVMLESLGHEVEMASDGFEALAKLIFDIDLVMLDVEMPIMDGYEVARQIRSDPAHNDIPIIFSTGMNSREDRVRAVEAGGNDFISKPVELTELKVRTSSLLKIKDVTDALKSSNQKLEETVANRTVALRKALDGMVETQRLLREAHIESICCLVAAAEYKDSDTAFHIQRMSHISSLLAKKLRLPPGDVELIHHASPMHDIGKIGTPEKILQKPGKLTTNEFQIIKQHALLGSQILTKSNSDIMRIGMQIALTHHEKWDGSGYPNGLAGEDISIFGRICAVADVFDALTHERPYKKAYSIEASLKIIQDGAGKHFDPELVDIFSKNIDEVLRIQPVRN
jgi:putative two-component system response regulator